MHPFWADHVALLEFGADWGGAFTMSIARADCNSRCRHPHISLELTASPGADHGEPNTACAKKGAPVVREARRRKKACWFRAEGG
jgi:hypothetical protein